MADRISNDAPRNACRRPEDDQADQVMSKAEDPVCRDGLVSAAPPDWDRIPNTCDANAAAAAKNAIPAGPASSNAGRTAERAAGPYAEAGKTKDGLSVFAGAAAIKGTKNGVQVEVASVSAQVGAEKEVQVAMLRLGASKAGSSVSGEAFTASAHVGIHNSDGSVGLHVGATATVVAVEATGAKSGSSSTMGLSAGRGAEAHVGVRDIDGDHKPEVCFRVAMGPVIVGKCLEIPVVIKP